MQSSDQGKISPIKNLDPGCKWFYRRYECDYPLLDNAYNTVVWEKFMVRNIREKKIRGKKFSSMQAIDENFLTPNISYMHILTCTLNYHLLFFLS